MIVDESTEFGRRTAAHLRDDLVVWLTTVSPSGAPLPTPVWFLWDGEDTVRLRSLPSARRVAHVRENPHVSLNFAGNGTGGDIVVLSGTARLGSGEADAPGDAYVAKYREDMARLGTDPEGFMEQYAQPIVIELTRLRGH